MIHRHVLAAVVYGLLCAPGAAAQVRPVETIPSGSGLRLEFERTIRQEAEALLQDWVNLVQQRDFEGLSRYYAERGVLAWHDGRRAVGRAEIRALLAPSLGDARAVEIAVGELTPGSALASVTGQLRYRDASGETQAWGFLVVLEKQIGRWIVRHHAFAEAAGPAGGGTIRPSPRRPTPPERLLLRAVVEAGVLRGPEPSGAGGSSVGLVGAAGLAVGHVAEASAQLTRHAGLPATDGAAHTAGAELRLYAGQAWRLDPFLSLGASRFLGDAARDSTLVPAVGLGARYRLRPGLSVQAALRAEMPRRPGEHRGASWMTVPREARRAAALGVAVHVGRRPAWTDPTPTEEQQRYTASVEGAVLGALGRWHAALEAGDIGVAEHHYTLDATLVEPGGAAYRGRPAIAARWATQSSRRGPLRFEVNEVRASGPLALVRGGWGEVPGGETLLVLQEQGGHWRIRAQLLLSAPPAGS
jgi:ketosteroid isomerase-like protein